MNLHELPVALAHALDQIEYDEKTGEIVSGWEAVEAIDMELEKKLESYALAYKNISARAAALAAEIRNFQCRKKSADRTLERLENSIKEGMEKSGKDKLSTAKAALSFRKSETVEVSDRGAIPAAYLRYKEPEPDKNAIKAAIKAGTQVPGAYLASNRNLQIK